jgi:hypothetical protein
VTIAAGSKDPDVSAAFTVPTVYYGAFAGDLDDGTNAFKQWYARKRALGRRLHQRIQVTVVPFACRCATVTCRDVFLNLIVCAYVRVSKAQSPASHAWLIGACAETKPAATHKLDVSLVVRSHLS